MFLNIFSVTLSEDFIAYILLHFTYPLRQVSSTKPCILACRIRVLSAIRKEFLRCRFSFRRPSKPKKTEEKQTPSGIFAHTKTASGRFSVLRTARKKLPHNRDEIFPLASETL